MTCSPLSEHNLHCLCWVTPLTPITNKCVHKSLCITALVERIYLIEKSSSYFLLVLLNTQFTRSWLLVYSYHEQYNNIQYRIRILDENINYQYLPDNTRLSLMNRQVVPHTHQNVFHILALETVKKNVLMNLAPDQKHPDFSFRSTRWRFSTTSSIKEQCFHKWEPVLFIFCKMHMQAYEHRWW